MISHPRPGQVVRLHYAASKRRACPLHGRVGTVVAISRGPGPRNVGVEIDGIVVMVPRGNLVRGGLP